MSKKPVKTVKHVKPGNQQTRVLNETQEAIRAQKLALRDKDAEIREQQANLDSAIEEGNDWQAQQDARDLERLRRERLSMAQQLEKLSESQFGYRDLLGEMDTQNRIRAMNEQKARLFEKTDVVGIFQSGQTSEKYEIGLEQIREITSPSEEKQSQKNQAVDTLMAEARARLQSKNNTNAAPVVAVATTASPVQRRVNTSKYSQADDLLDFL